MTSMATRIAEVGGAPCCEIQWSDARGSWKGIELGQREEIQRAQWERK